jgi:hypothetical protein
MNFDIPYPGLAIGSTGVPEPQPCKSLYSKNVVRIPLDLCNDLFHLFLKAMPAVSPIARHDPCRSRPVLQVALRRQSMVWHGLPAAKDRVTGTAQTGIIFIAPWFETKTAKTIWKARRT